MSRAARVCPKQGCIELVTGNARYCQAHERKRQRKQFRKRYREGRVTTYGPQWKQIRDEYLAAHPFCVVCGGKATEVDHIVPYAESQDHSWSNLQSLCKPHHSQKTARRDGGFGNARDRDE